MPNMPPIYVRDLKEETVVLAQILLYAILIIYHVRSLPHLMFFLHFLQFGIFHELSIQL